jgi:divalent metal cation (Fe/Co/Zn/Cd) transporter
MKTLATIALSLIAIVASLILVLSTICTFKGDIAGHKEPSYLICAVVALAVVVVTLWAIAKLNKKP